MSEQFRRRIYITKVSNQFLPLTSTYGLFSSQCSQTKTKQNKIISISYDLPCLFQVNTRDVIFATEMFCTLPKWYNTNDALFLNVSMFALDHNLSKNKLSGAISPSNSMWPSDAIWRHSVGSTLARVSVLPDGTKPLLEAMLIKHKWSLAAFTWR